jgi:predicted N-acyltransferase
VHDKWGQAYLTRDFFRILGRDMRDSCLLVLAHDSTGALLAGALHLLGGNSLYGRNWGCSKKVDSLHFELCYYQAIEAAIEMKLVRVEAGAQGEHKIAR